MCLTLFDDSLLDLNPDTDFTPEKDVETTPDSNSVLSKKLMQRPEKKKKKSLNRQWFRQEIGYNGTYKLQTFAYKTKLKKWTCCLLH